MLATNGAFILCQLLPRSVVRIIMPASSPARNAVSLFSINGVTPEPPVLSLTSGPQFVPPSVVADDHETSPLPPNTYPSKGSRNLIAGASGVVIGHHAYPPFVDR